MGEPVTTRSQVGLHGLDGVEGCTCPPVADGVDVEIEAHGLELTEVALESGRLEVVQTVVGPEGGAVVGLQQGGGGHLHQAVAVELHLAEAQPSVRIGVDQALQGGELGIVVGRGARPEADLGPQGELPGRIDGPPGLDVAPVDVGAGVGDGGDAHRVGCGLS